MKIAIMDDNNMHIEALKNELNYIENNDIKCFNAVDKLKKYLKSNNIDVLFLDIDLGDNKNGIELAEEFSELYPNMMIIYITAYNDRFSQDIFMHNSNLCGYLVKPIRADKLSMLMSRVKPKIIERKKNIVVLKQQNKLSSVLANDIMYAESKDHYVYVYTINDVYSFYGKLNKFTEKLPHVFIYPHKSFIVNVNYVKHIEREYITLNNDVIIPVSRSRYNDFRNEFLKLMAGILL